MALPNEGLGGDLPLRLGGGAVLARAAKGFDVYVDGVPFLLKINDDLPFADRSTQWRKEQFDATPEPGEQSLSDWWTRSQLSFHGGAGQKYLDSYADGDEVNRIRFDTSWNVEVFEPGEVTVLPASEQILPASGGIGAGVVASFTDASNQRTVLATDGGQVRRWRETGAVDAVTVGSGGVITGAATDGDRLYVVSADGVYAVTAGLVATKLYDVPAGVSYTLGWAKQRLLLAAGRGVYELSTAPGSSTLPAALYNHPVVAWSWTCFGEGPTSILLAGRAGTQSAIYEFQLTEAAGAPTLGAGQVAASMPTGEVVYSLFGYAGSFVGIGTSKGLRIGRFDEYYGTLSYGPLSIETTLPVRSITGQDRFLLCGLQSVDGYSSCLAKLDLGMPVDQGGRFAWSTHQPPAALTQAPIRHVTVDSLGLLLFSIDGVGTIRQAPATTTTQTAWLATSRIRMGTLEPKVFRYVRTRAELETGQSIGVLPTGGAQSTVTPASLTERFLVNTRGEWASLRFTLSPRAKLTGYTLYALPAQDKYRTLTIPVHLFNKERARTGVEYGTNSWAQQRLAAVKEIERRGDEVELLIPALGYDPMRGVVEETTFVQDVAPTDRGRGMGGVLQITFRTTR